MVYSSALTWYVGTDGRMRMGDERFPDNIRFSLLIQPSRSFLLAKNIYSEIFIEFISLIYKNESRGPLWTKNSIF